MGVIDAGFRRYAALGAEVPAPAGEKCEQDAPTDCLSAVADNQDYRRPSRQGTAVAEAIHDIAPDAQLYLASASSRGELSEAVDWMTAQGVDVINMSLSWPWDGPPDGSSPYENGAGRLDRQGGSRRRGVGEFGGRPRAVSRGRASTPTPTATG